MGKLTNERLTSINNLFDYLNQAVQSGGGFQLIHPPLSLLQEQGVGHRVNLLPRTVFLGVGLGARRLADGAHQLTQLGAHCVAPGILAGVARVPLHRLTVVPAELALDHRRLGWGLVSFHWAAWGTRTHNGSLHGTLRLPVSARLLVKVAKLPSIDPVPGKVLPDIVQKLRFVFVFQAKKGGEIETANKNQIEGSISELP